MKNTYKILSASILAAFSVNANAQWATINVQDVINRMYTMSGFNSVTGAVTTLNSSTQQQMKQTAQNQQDTDMRNRYSMYQNNLLNQTGGTIKPQPTIQDCIAASPKNNAANAGVRAAGGGGGSKYSPTKDVAQGPKQEAELNSKILADKASLGTCVPNDNGVSGCTDSYGSKAGADWHPRGLDGNAKGIPMNAESNSGGKPIALYNDYTLDAEYWKATSKNIAAQTGYNLPKSLTAEQNKANPNYDATIIPINAKISAAQEALYFSARMKQMPNEKPPGGSTADTLWNGGADYANITGLAGPAPDKPSLYDVLNYGAYNGLVGTSKGSLDIEELNRRVALTNFILWKQFQQQEQANRLLANILMQQVAPVSMGAADGLYKDAISRTPGK